MIRALGLGLLAQSSLLFAGLFACWVKVPRKVIGTLAGFGAGAMLAAISFDLVAESQELETWQFGLWSLVGAAVFMVGDRIVEARFGEGGEGGAMGIVVGSVVDGVPESIIFGIQIASGFPVSVSFLTAVLVSNIPQAIAPSSELSTAGWSAGRVGRLWIMVVLACGVAAALGFLAADMSGITGERMAALAAGGLLAMLANSLIPFSYERAGELAGVGTVVGFCFGLIST